MPEEAKSTENRARIEERFQRDWSLELPESMFRFWALHESLDPEERRAMHDDLWLSPAGIMDLFANPGARPRDGIDVRVHWRFYRPEMGRAYSNRYTPAVIPPIDPDRITTLDNAGALVAGETALDRPAHNGADEAKFARYMYGLFRDAEAFEGSVADARSRCAAGDPAEALVLGRDLHWASGGDPAREAHARELLVMAYRALDRPSLTEIADAHHRHRNLPSVDILDKEQT